MKIKKIFLRDIIEYVLALFIILGTSSMLIECYGINRNIISIICLILFVILIGLEKISKSKLYMIWPMFVYIVADCMINIFLTRYNVLPSFLRICLTTAVAFVYFISVNEIDRLLIKISNVIFVFAVISLVLFIGGTIAHIIPSTGTASYTWGINRVCNQYFGIQFESQIVQQEVLGIKYRNCGFFPEAPMFNAVLCIGVSIDFYLKEIMSKKRICIWILTILSTMTTTGVVVIGLMVFIKIISNENQYTRSKKIKFVVMVFIIPISIVIGLLFINEIIMIKNSTSLGSDSSSIRLDHLKACIEMWRNRPLFGHGFENNAVFYRYTTADQGYSVGLPYLLATNGLLYMLIYIIPLISNCYYFYFNYMKGLYFCIVLFTVSFLTAIVYCPIFVILMAYGVAFFIRRINARKLSF